MPLATRCCHAVQISLHVSDQWTPNDCAAPTSSYRAKAEDAFVVPTVPSGAGAEFEDLTAAKLSAANGCPEEIARLVSQQAAGSARAAAAAILVLTDGVQDLQRGGDNCIRPEKRLKTKYGEENAGCSHGFPDENTSEAQRNIVKGSLIPPCSSTEDPWPAAFAPPRGAVPGVVFRLTMRDTGPATVGRDRTR